MNVTLSIGINFILGSVGCTVQDFGLISNSVIRRYPYS